MCHKKPLISTHSPYQKVGSKQRGSMLITAIFVMVIFSLLLAAIVNMFESTTESISVEVYGVRALMAANSGVDRVAASIFPVNGARQSCAAIGTPLSSNATFSSVDGLFECSYIATCTDFTENDGVEDIVFYKIQSTGQCDIGGSVMTRTVEVEARGL